MHDVKITQDMESMQFCLIATVIVACCTGIVSIVNRFMSVF